MRRHIISQPLNTKPPTGKTIIIANVRCQRVCMCTGNPRVNIQEQCNVLSLGEFRKVYV